MVIGTSETRTSRFYSLYQVTVLHALLSHQISILTEKVITLKKLSKVVIGTFCETVTQNIHVW